MIREEKRGSQRSEMFLVYIATFDLGLINMQQQ